MIAVIQQIRRGAAVVPHGVRVFDGGAEAVVEVRGLDLMLRVVQNVALGGGDLRIVPDAVIGVLVVHAEQGDAVFAALLSGLDHSAVDDPVVLVQLIQLELRVVQGVAVLRVHLLNGEEVLVVIVVTAVLAPSGRVSGIAGHGFRNSGGPAIEGITAAGGRAVKSRRRNTALKARIHLVFKCAAVRTVSIGHGVGGHGKLQLGGIFGRLVLALAFKLERVRSNKSRDLDRTVDIALGNDLQILAAAQFALRGISQGQGDPGEGDDGAVISPLYIFNHAGDRPVAIAIFCQAVLVTIGETEPVTRKLNTVKATLSHIQLFVELDVQVHLAAGEHSDLCALHIFPDRTSLTHRLDRVDSCPVLRV